MQRKKERVEGGSSGMVLGSKLASPCFSKFSMLTNHRDSWLTGTMTQDAAGGLWFPLLS